MVRIAMKRCRTFACNDASCAMRRKALPRARLIAISASIESRIFTVRGTRVMLDSDLAELYRVSTKALNQGVRRNAARFPADFAFQLTVAETTNLRSQSVTSSLHGGRRYRPLAFTEQGVAMLSSVLSSPRAVSVNVAIMRAFVRLRELALTHVELTRKIADLEKKYDGKFAVVFQAIRDLAALPAASERPRPQIGFIRASHGTGARIRR